MITRKQAKTHYNSGSDVVVGIICDLSRQVDKQQKEIDKQQKEIDTLQSRVAKLTKNSTNSSKPPSSDIINKTPKKKKKGKRKIGAQPGHKRNVRPAFTKDEIDKFFDYQLSACPDCQHPDVVFVDEPPRVIQQMELKEVVVIKEEHRSFPIWCPHCKKIHFHPFPEHVVKEGLFKERITALVAYMKAVDHASFSTIRKFVRDVLDEKVSRGYLRKVIEKVSHALDAPYEELLQRLPLEATLNVDETGHKENGDKFWTWVFRADLYVLFKIDKSRGSKVLIDVLGEEFNGVLGCDYFSAYHKYMKDFCVTIQFCIAHLIRDIKYLTGLRDAKTKRYGKELLSKVKGMFKIIHNREKLDSESFQDAMENARDAIIKAATDKVPSRLSKEGKELNNEAFNMSVRFQKHAKAYFTFITTPGMEPTNNVAEQAIRFIVIDRRITQGTRSEKGRETNERLWTIVGTCSLQGRSAFEFILQAVHSLFWNKPTPSLLSGFT